MGARSGDRPLQTLGPPAAAGRAVVSSRLTLRQRMWREWWMYLFLLPGLIYFVVFRYLPLLGNIAAFQDYSPVRGFRGSPFTGLENIRRLFTDPDLGIALRNTLAISLLQLVLFFPAPIVLALLLNTMLYDPLKRLMQSVLYLP